MVEQYAIVTPTCPPLVLSGIRVYQAVPASLAQNMAQGRAAKKRVRGLGYRRAGQTSGALMTLQQRFLTVAIEECPQLLVDLQAMRPVAAKALDTWKSTHHPWDRLPAGMYPADLMKLPDALPGQGYIAQFPPEVQELARALIQWSEPYHLAAPWVLKGATTAFEEEHLYGKPFHFRPGLFTYATPAAREHYEYVLPVYDGEVGPATYKERVLRDFKRALDAYVRERVREPDVMPGVQALPEHHPDTMRSAARWQVLGDRDLRDRGAVRDLLTRILLSPRPGL